MGVNKQWCDPEAWWRRAGCYVDAAPPFPQMASSKPANNESTGRRKEPVRFVPSALRCRICHRPERCTNINGIFKLLLVVTQYGSSKNATQNTKKRSTKNVNSILSWTRITPGPSFSSFFCDSLKIFGQQITYFCSQSSQNHKIDVSPPFYGSSRP